MIKKIREILKGIDKDISQDNDGWWETSTGAEFGAKKLKEIESLVKNCSIPDVVESCEGCNIQHIDNHSDRMICVKCDKRF